MSTTVRSRCNSGCRIRAWGCLDRAIRPRALLIGGALGVRPATDSREGPGSATGGGEMEATGNRIEPGRVIGEAFETYQSQAGPLLGGALIVIGIAGVIEGILAIT